MSTYRWSAALASLLAGLGGCQVISGLGGLHAGTGGGDASSSSTSGGGMGGGPSNTSVSATSASSSSSGTGGATSSSSSGTSSTSSGGCVGEEICVSVPTGWTGPIALQTDTKTPICNEPGWPTADPEVNGGTSIKTSGGCSACSCTGPTGTCPNSAVVREFGQVNCAGSPTTVTMTTSCQSAMPSAAVGNTTTATNLMCQPVDSALNATAAFDTYALGCSGGVTGTCAGGVCATPATHLCIYATGTSLCPPSFPQTTVVYGAIDQSFACTACTCGIAAAPTCTPTTTFYTDTNCQTSIDPALPHDGTCGTYGNPPGAAKITDVGTPSGGSCAVTGGGQLTGSAVGTSPTTVCCMN